MIISYHGPEKAGKTTLGFTLAQSKLVGEPNYVAHFDFDLGRERAIWRFKEVADHIITYPLQEPVNWNVGSGSATQLWQTFDHHYTMALATPDCKGLFIDTGTQMWKADTQEYLENHVRRQNPKRIQLLQIEYRMPNDRMRAKILAARTAGKHLVISHYEADEYQEMFVQKPDGHWEKESVKSGNKVHAGFNDMRNLTDLHLYLYPKMEQINGKWKMVAHARVETSLVWEAVGMDIVDPTFDKFVMLIRALRGEI